MTSQCPQVVDACILINLLASDEIARILEATGRQSLICSKVQAESIYLRTNDPTSPKEKVDLEPLIKSGLLVVCDVEGDQEAELYVDYASVLDDGEAMSLAIAVSRNYVLATDERKARRLFLEAVGDPERLTSTSALLRQWGEDETSINLKQTLLKIETRARYQPPVADSNHQWWIDASR